MVQELKGPDLTTVHYKASPRELRKPISDQVASELQDMMTNVVANGTGRKAQIAGYTVAGKTGTAQAGENNPDHGWFIGYVMKNNQPISAVAVLLESAGDGGSGEASRIAGQVMSAVIADRGGN
jgi:peptidoglycan glycosyltransferase